MVVKEEPSNLGCSSELKNLQSECVVPINDSNDVNEDEIIEGLEDHSDELGEDSNSAKTQDSTGSEAGEIDDSSSKEQVKKSGSEAGEIDKEEPFDVEEGEISETDEKKTVCRFFLRGCCYYGSQCQFLHVSNKVYKMFDLPAPSNGSKDTIVPSFPPQIPEHPMEEGSSWEKGLITAKVMIQDSIKKRKEDKEFENKKLYISPEILRSPVYSREKEFKSKCKASDEKAIQAEPVKDLTDTRGRKEEKQSTLNKENSKSEYKWVDPWMRSNKDSKTHTSKRKHKKRHFSLSSTSSLDDIDINPKPAPKKRLPTKPSSRDSCCKSYSRSISRSRSSSRTHFSYQNHSRKNSPSYRKPKRRKIRRSSSLEKWYKKEVSTARHSRSPSCSSLDSFKSYESSMTISSLSCSQTSSCSSSSNEHRSNPTKRNKKSLNSKVDHAFPQRQRIAASSIENLQAYIRPAKQKDLNLKETSLKQRDLNLKDTSLKQRNLNLKDASLKQKDPNPKDTLKQRDLNLKDTSLKQRDLNQKDASLKQRDLNLKDTSLKQRDLSLKDASLKQRDASPKHTQVTVPVVKSPIKPVVKRLPKKKNPALNELLRYTNIKPKASSNISQTSEQQASKLQDLDCSTSDCKGVVSTNPRRNITLNLQTSKLLKQKVPEVQTKQSGASELSNKEIISKKESLLKQLRLVEQAIARKKNSY